MRVILSEILTTEYAISTPFNALFGRVPVMVYAVLDRTVVLQIIGEDDKRVVRHDFVTVEPEELRMKPSPIVDQKHKSRVRGRENSHKHENGAEEENIFDEAHYDSPGGAKYDPLALMAKKAESTRSKEG